MTGSRAWLLPVLALMAVVVGACDTSPDTPDIKLALSAPGDQVVGVPFTVKGDVIFQGNPDISFDLTSKWSTTGPLVPSAPSSSKTQVSDDYSDVVTFTCIAAGPAAIGYLVEESDHSSAIGTEMTSLTCREAPSASPSPDSSAPPKPTKFRTLVSNPVGPVGGGDVAGDVQLAEPKDGSAGTDIVVEAKGPAEALPVTLNQGGCDSRGPLVQALSPMTNGTSTTRLPGTLPSYLTGGYSVHVATSAKPETDIACGAIAKGRIIAMGPGPDGDQTPADVALVDQAAFGTEVSVFSTPESVSAVQPLAIIKGSCPGSGTVAFQLTDTRGGRSRTVVEASFDELLHGGYSVQLSRSAAEPDKIVACVNLAP